MMKTEYGKLYIPAVRFDAKVWSYIYFKMKELDDVDILLLIPLYTGKYPPSLNLNEISENIIQVYYNKYPDGVFYEETNLPKIPKVLEIKLTWGRNFYKYLLNSSINHNEELKEKLLKLLDNSEKKEKQRRKKLKWKKKTR